MYRFAIVIVALLFSSTDAAAMTYAEYRAKNPSDCCQAYTGREHERCLTRRVRRTQTSRYRGLQNSQEVQRVRVRYRSQLRQTIHSTREQRNATRARQRTTIRTHHTVQDINTNRRGFLRQYRNERLQCMLIAARRSRSICLEAVENQVRDDMQPEPGLTSRQRGKY